MFHAMLGLLASVYCSIMIQEPFLDVSPANRFEPIFAETQKVLDSPSDSLDFKSAENFLASSKQLLEASTSKLTKKILICIELQCELILTELRNSRSTKLLALIHKSKRWNLKRKITALMEMITFYPSPPRSDNKNLYKLGDLTSDDLLQYRKSNSNSTYIFGDLGFDFAQYRKILIYLSDPIIHSCPKPRIKETLLRNYYWIGHTAKLPIRTYEDASKPLIYFVNALDEIALSAASLSQEEMTAFKLQYQSILKEIASSKYTAYPSHINAIDVSIQLSSNLCVSTEDIVADKVPLSSIVIDDLNRERSFNRYEQSLLFLEKTEIFLSYEPLREYLNSSVRNRHHVVPDYDTDEDILDALETAQVFRPGLSNIEIRLFCFVTKFFIRSDKENFHRGIVTFQTIEIPINGSFGALIGFWSMRKRIWSKELAPIPDFVNLILPGTSDECIEKILKSSPNLSVLEIIAVSFLSNFTHPVIHKLIADFDKPKYDDFCPGSEEFKELLKEKAKKVPLKYKRHSYTMLC
jgi:hypothetical protein